MLIDQGSADEFLEKQLKPDLFLAACEEADYPVQFISREGYDHSYFFIASFIEEHLRFHQQDSARGVLNAGRLDREPDQKPAKGCDKLAAPVGYCEQDRVLVQFAASCKRPDAPQQITE